MRSRGFSPDAHYFKYVAKRYSWLALISLAVIGFHTWAGWFLFSWSSGGGGYAMNSETGELIFGIEIPKIGTFKIMNSDSGLGTTLPYAAAIIGIIYAATLFGFLWRKKESFSTLSLGVSLRNQFLIRYLFGAGLMLLCDFVSFALSYVIHLDQVGGDTIGLTLPYSLCYFAVYIVLALCLYTLAVFVTVLSGRIVDYLLSICGILAAPYAIGSVLRHIFANFLQGSSLGLSMSEKDQLGFYSDSFPSVFEFTNKFGAFTAFADKLEAASIPANTQGGATITELSIEAYRTEYVTLPYIPFFIMLGVTVLLAVLSCFFFIRRPAEYSGKAGIYPALYVSASLMSALGIASFVGLINVNRFLMMLLLSAAFVLLFFTLCSIYRATVKGFFKNYRSAIGTVAAICLCFLICFFGAFGYSDYIPDTAEVESVAIKHIGSPTVLNGTGSGWMTATFADGFYDNVEYSVNKFKPGFISLRGRLYDGEMPVLTSANDIDLAREVHKFLIDDGMKTRNDCGKAKDNYSESVLEADIFVVYTLKDGTKVERLYKYVSLAAAEKICSIEESEAFRKLYIDKRLNNDDVDNWKAIYVSGTTSFESADEFFSNLIPLDTLTTEQNDALFEALTLDFAELSYEDRYYSDDDVIGVLRFYQAKENKSYSSGDFMPESRGNDTWYITDKYTRTLGLLEDYGLMGNFESRMTLLAVDVQDYDIYINGENPSGVNTILVIQSSNNVIHCVGNGTVTSIPESEWDHYLENTRAVAATTRGGKIVRFTYKDSGGNTTSMTRFMPNN